MKSNNQKGNAAVGIVIIIALIWGISSLFSSNKAENDNYVPSSYNSASVYSSYGSYNNYADSNYSDEPENPYNDGSGHYAGYEWAQENDVSSCGGNSNSFIEGCEEYLSQQEN